MSAFSSGQWVGRWVRNGALGLLIAVVVLSPAAVAGSNAALDGSIRLRPELLDFLRQDHLATATLEETLARLDSLAAKLEGAAPVAAVATR